MNIEYIMYSFVDRDTLQHVNIFLNFFFFCVNVHCAVCTVVYRTLNFFFLFSMNDSADSVRTFART